MVTTEEFFSIYSKESDRVEMKLASNGIPKDMWETYSSFANTSGGTIILGIAEDQTTGTFSVAGIENVDKTIKTLWDNLYNTRFVSRCILHDNDVEVVDVDDKNVIVIKVPKATIIEKPIFIFGDVIKGTYKRKSEGDYHCNYDEVMSMVRDSFPRSSDTEGISDAGIDCLDMGSFRLFLTSVKNSGKSQRWTYLNEAETMDFLGLCKDVDGRKCLTKAGLLMFGKIQCILSEFPGFFLDYLECTDGNRWTYRINSNDQILNVFSFITEVSARLSMVIGTPFKLDGIRHEKESDTFRAVREALINSLVHADYEVSNPRIRIVYDGEKISMTNPGTMRISISDAVTGGKSDPRNQAMMRIAMLGDLVENAGSGIRYIVNVKDSGDLLNFKMEENDDPLSVKTTLWLPVTKIRMNDTETRILRHIQDNEHASQKEIADAIGVSLSTVNRTVAKLKTEGILELTGTNRNVTWIIHRL